MAYLSYRLTTFITELNYIDTSHRLIPIFGGRWHMGYVWFEDELHI